MNKLKTFLALGDSYTIGESVPEKVRWPVQLMDHLKKHSNHFLAPPHIVARTGWTTGELIAGISEQSLSPPYDLVSLLIGVNNQYRGYPVEVYEREFEKLLERSINLAGQDRKHVFVISIPDYGVTPFASEKRLDSEKIAREIDEYNHLAENICSRYEVDYFNITPLSKKVENDPELVAPDGLHPSGKMYNQWVELIKHQVVSFLDQ